MHVRSFMNVNYVAKTFKDKSRINKIYILNDASGPIYTNSLGLCCTKDNTLTTLITSH